MNFGLNPVGGGLSLVRILGSISKTLGMVRQVAPIYKEIKPLFAKAPEFFARINNMRGMLQSARMSGRMLANQTTIEAQSGSSPTQNVMGGPVFFQ